MMLAHINKATEPQRHSGVASSTYAVRQLASLRASVPPWLHWSSIAGARAAGTIFIALCAALIAAVPARAEILERVLAVVGTEMITLTDVTAARDFGLVVVPPGSEDPIRAALTQLIDRELMLAEVDRYAPPEPSADAIDEGLRIVRSRFADDGAYQAALTRSGIDENHLRETLRQNLRITAYLNQRFIMPPPDASGRPPGPDRQRTLVDDWIAGLRRRAAIIDLYLPSR